MATEYVCVYVCIHPVFSKGTYTYFYMHVGKHKRQLMEVEDALNRTHGMCAGMCPWRAAGKVGTALLVLQMLVRAITLPYACLSQWNSLLPFIKSRNQRDPTGSGSL